MRLFGIIVLFMFSSVMAQESHIISNGSAQIHYRVFGQGKPLLIINGGPGMNSDGFSHLAEELSKFGYQTITYDQRGTGKSTVTQMDAQNINMKLMSDDMEALRRRLQFKTWSIFGHSFGGIMMAYYASQHPDKIDKLIFSNAGGLTMDFTSYLQDRIQANLTAAQRDSLAYYQNKQNSGDTSEVTRQARAKYLAYAYVHNPKNAPIIAQRLLQLYPEVNNLVIQDLFKIKYDCRKKFKNFHQPVLVLQGKNDILKVETAQEIQQAFPSAKLILMDHCAHYGWLDAPDVFYSTVQQFLNEK